MKRAILVSGLALLALGACAKQSETAATGAAPASASAPAEPPTSVTLPARKAGLWEQTVTLPRMTQTTKMCLDAAFDQKMKVWGGAAGKSDCAEQRITPHLGGFCDVYVDQALPVVERNCSAFAFGWCLNRFRYGDIQIEWWRMPGTGGIQMITLTILALLLFVPASRRFFSTLCSVVLGLLGLAFLITRDGTSRR